jgi:hypothetical protein
VSRGRGVGFNLGPFTIQPAPKRAPKRPKVKPPPLEHGGWPNGATWGVATMIDRPQVRVMATQARAQARDAYAALTEPRQTNVATAILASMLHGWCEECAGLDGMEPMASLLTTAGLDVVAWDVLARRALTP